MRSQWGRYNLPRYISYFVILEDHHAMKLCEHINCMTTPPGERRFTMFFFLFLADVEKFRGRLLACCCYPEIIPVNIDSMCNFPKFWPRYIRICINLPCLVCVCVNQSGSCKNGVTLESNGLSFINIYIYLSCFQMKRQSWGNHPPCPPSSSPFLIP